MSKFQAIVIGICIVAALAGLMVFATFKGGGTEAVPTTIIWGTIDRSFMAEFLDTALKPQNETIKYRYVQKNPATLYEEYVEALAVGDGPDAVLMSHDQVLKFKGKIIDIPYTYFPEKEYKSTFVEQGELYLSNAGISALPFTIDPMVMFWNRDIFTNALVPTPPQTWEELSNLIPRLTKRDAATNITQSAVGFGEYRNIAHAKDIMSLLILQAGNAITTPTASGVKSVLSDNQRNSVAVQALNFYTAFANPTKLSYTWNKSLPNSKTLFLGNKLGIYFGYASELADITEKNPNLNFDIAIVPQQKTAAGATAHNMTYGKLYGFSLARSSPYPEHTVSVLKFLTSKSTLALWAKQTGQPSVRRDSLTLDPSSAVSYVFSISSLWSRGWLDPDYIQTTNFFGQMIEDVTSGKLLPEAAVRAAHNRIQDLTIQQ
ncbi:extracellular solute-binding protein [Candidatus Parcubacteria bacterium]|nr:extracellular solute-binding protein [Candidatus Parcubacteria bacterium]